MFKIAVLEYGVSYDRFREDFINSHTFHDDEDADSRNDHLVNLGRIGALLSLREDLVRTYSSKGTDRGSFFTCMEEFMLEKDLRIKTRFTNFECHLDARALKVMTEAVNDIPLFKRNLTVQEVDALFNDCETPSDGPLVANRNEVFVYFFSMLHFHSVISDRYQSVIADRHLVLSSSGRKYLTRKDLSTALSHFETVDSPIKARIDRWVVLIKKEMFRSGHDF